ncbi:G patch domain-containing protein 1 isoform X1 [Tachyglossus aculeatus]|uniref:G patch domain-containing protein 1 isoform X1 n=1 Tax=Tachyglossus aculeatus TaxID=9261 RepID=UPI0018F49060|nr:G patch domain-containing protein 1 isoform X1 [Tachyglossus aculeatus]
MAASGGDSDEDMAAYGTRLEPLEEGQRPKKPVPLQEQTVRDEKGRYKRFHGAFSGGFSAGYFNTVGSKEGWEPSAFISSRQNRADKSVLGPEDFMDEEDFSEYGIAPKSIVTTDDFASKTKDRIKEKARQLAAAVAPIPGATILDDLIAPARLSIGFELLRKMGWKEGQGVGPRVKRKARRKKPDPGVKIYGCALPPGSSEGSEDEEEYYLPDNVTFAPKDVTPVDFTPKDDVHGLAYKGLDPHKALFGISEGEHFNIFTGGCGKTSNLLGDVKQTKGRKLGISGQAFGVGALEEEDDDIYATEMLSKYDTVLKDEEPGDGLYGWTAPKQYKDKKGLEKDIRYMGKILDGFSLASKPSSSKKIYPPPELPKDYRPFHYFRPVIAAGSENSHLLQALAESSGKLSVAMPQQSRHQLNASKRRELLGETPLQGPATSILEFLSQKDKERIKEMKQATELKAAEMKAKTFAQQTRKSRFQSNSADTAHCSWQTMLSRDIASAVSSEFKPFAKNPEKQKRYEEYLGGLKQGHKDALETCLDSNMTEWEQGRERDEFIRAAVLYKSSNSTLSSRFTHAKHEDDTDQVEVPRDQESDINDKQSAVKMKMFGKLTRDKFEWHPDKLLCRRFNVPDPYSDSTMVGLPKVKRDKYSVFNFLTLSESAISTTSQASSEKGQQNDSSNKPRKPSRWDMSDQEKRKKDSISEFISMARSEVENEKQQTDPTVTKDERNTTGPFLNKVTNENAEQKDEEESSRPPMDLFKAIFADSSDEKSSSSDEEEEEVEEEKENENENNWTDPGGSGSKSSKQADPLETSYTLQVCQKVTNQPVLAVPLQKKLFDRGEEFGPRLPPVFCPNARQKHEVIELTSSPDTHQKGKKKNKEKHKTKKGYKHKKEKKKKHRKHKHKGKHKNKKSEKSSSSETDSSDSSQSDVEEITDISPQELLRRLKNLPITKK